jgi:hypothetical protein
MTAEPPANAFRSAVLSGKTGRHDDLIARSKTKRVDRSSEGLAGVAVSRQEARRSNQRGNDRHRLNGETAKVRVGRRTQPVELINVSGGGAMIKGNLKLKLWDRVELCLGEGGTVECAVRWIRGDSIGLEFAHETRLDCNEDERAELLRQVITRSFDNVSFETPQALAPSDVEQPTAVAPGSEQRIAKRHPLIWTGVLHHDYQSSPIRVRNISSTGAMIECCDPVRVGTEPLLELSDAISVSGTVAWVVGDQVGFNFHSPFDLGQLAESRPEVAPSEWIRPAYLASESTGDSPWDPRWNRLSVGELRSELEGFLKR